MSKIEMWLFNHFKEMPPSLRVLTYLVFLFLYVYLILAPQYIGGKIIFTTEDGYELPYNDQQILYTDSDRDLKSLTDEEGNWRIPLSGRIPRKLNITLYNIETHKYMRYTISRKEIFLKNYIHLNIRNGKLVKIAARPELDDGFLMKLFGGQRLYAEELKLPESILNSTKPIVSEDIISKQIMDIVLSSSKVGSNVFNKDLNIFDSNKVSPVEQMIIYDKIKKTYNLSIPSEQWKSLKNVSEIESYISNRLILNKYIENNNLKITPSFRNQIEALPLDLQSQFQ